MSVIKSPIVRAFYLLILGYAGFLSLLTGLNGETPWINTQIALAKYPQFLEQLLLFLLIVFCVFPVQAMRHIILVDHERTTLNVRRYWYMDYLYPLLMIASSWVFSCVGWLVALAFFDIHDFRHVGRPDLFSIVLGFQTTLYLVLFIAALYFGVARPIMQTQSVLKTRHV